MTDNGLEQKPLVTETPDNTTIGVLGGREVSLLDVARVIHEQAPQIAQKAYETYSEKFDTAKHQEQKPVKIEDDVNQIICRQDWNYQTGKLDERRQIIIFLGPKTTNHEVLISYPRIRFHFKNNDSVWGYVGTEIGIRGEEISTNRIIAQYAEETGTPAYILETKVDMDDMERVLSPYMKTDSPQIPPSQT